MMSNFVFKCEKRHSVTYFVEVGRVKNEPRAQVKQIGTNVRVFRESFWVTDMSFEDD